MIRATFFMEQHIGHRSYYENLRQFIEPLADLDARWVEITYQHEDSQLARLPFLPSSLKGSLAGRAQVRAGLRTHPADIAIFNTQVPAALAANMVRRRPYILCTDITPHQYDRMGEHYGHRPDNGGLIARYKNRINQQLFRGAVRIFPWSSWVRDSLVEEYGIVPEQIEVIPPGVDTRWWRPGAPRPRGDEAMAILFVGGDFERKGGYGLLEAWKSLPPGVAHLIIVTRSAIPALDGLAGVTVHRHLQPNTQALLALYQRADVFVLPTHAEAFGIAAVEASASGLPVLATRVGGLTDIVVDEETGFLFPPGDVAGLARHLHALATQPTLRQAQGRAARARAKKHFDAAHNAERIANSISATVGALPRAQEKV